MSVGAKNRKRQRAERVCGVSNPGASARACVLLTSWATERIVSKTGTHLTYTLSTRNASLDLILTVGLRSNGSDRKGLRLAVRRTEKLRRALVHGGAIAGTDKVRELEGVPGTWA